MLCLERSQGERLSYQELKLLLLGTAEPSPTTAAATATMTGGRLNIAMAMQALGLVLQERGLPAMPGALLSEQGTADLRSLLLKNQWGQELLLGGAEAASEKEAAVELEALPVPPPSPAPNQLEAPDGWLSAAPPQQYHALEAEQQHVQLEAPAAAPMPLTAELLDAARVQTAQVEAAALPVQQQLGQPQAAPPAGADQQQVAAMRPQGARGQRRQQTPRAPAPA